MRKVIAIVLVLVCVFSFTSCRTTQNNDTVPGDKISTPSADTPSEYNGTAVSDDNILEAWTGEYSKEEHTEAIKEYRKNYSDIVIDAEKDDKTYISFETDFEVASCRVAALSPSGYTTDVSVELNSFVDLAVETAYYGKKVTVYTDWWHSGNNDWVSNRMVWAYLVCVTDKSDNDHYYYFRVDYSNMAETQK